MSDKQNFLNQIKGVLTNPSETLNNIDESGLNKGVLVVLTAAILAGLAQRIYLSKIPSAVFLSQLPINIANTQGLKNSVLTFSTLTSILGLLIFWLLSNILVHAISNQLSNGGSIKGIFAKTGYTAIILVIQQLIRLVDAFTASSHTITSLYTQQWAQEGFMKPVSAILGVFPLFRILYLILVGTAIAINYDMSRRKGTLISISSHLIFLIIPLLT